MKAKRFPKIEGGQGSGRKEVQTMPFSGGAQLISGGWGGGGGKSHLNSI